MPAKLPKFSYPVPSNKNGHAFSTAEDLLSKLDGESSGQYLVGSQGMWHGGIHITDATIPWCALSTNSAAEQQYRREPYQGEQFIRCMADGEIVAYRVCKDYESPAIPWRDEKLHFSTSFVLVKHYIQPGDTDDNGLTFYTLYMNLAPFSAYAQQSGDCNRKTASIQRYYSSVDDVLASRAAGSLVKDTSVALSDSIITRSSDRRQFTEVTIAEETKNTVGTTLSVGTKVWTVSDQGSLKAESSVPVPSWWAKCTPAYDAQPAGRVNCTSRTNWSYYLSCDDVLARKSAGKVVAGFPLTYEPDNAAQQVTRPVTVTAGAAPTDAVNIFSLVTLGRDVGKQKKGDRVWIVSDGDSLTPVTPTTSASTLVFGEVVKPATAMTINGGDSIGHMGFFQLPEENGKRSRYQVHIECFSMDDKLPTFLTNPDHVGEQTPAFLKYPKAAALFAKDAAGQMVDSTRKTLTQGIVTLSKVPVVDVDGRPAYYQIHRENGYLAASSVQKLSQYALGELGFVALDKTSESFNLLDGVQHPDNIVKGILEQMYKAAQDETRTSHVLNEHNYRRLLEHIDSNHDGVYSEQEYLQAVHNVSYRDHRYRIIAKHTSEWYCGKDDPLWKTYLDTLTTDAPLWKTYIEAFIEKIKWMEKVAGLGPNPWHMHPVAFLDAVNIRNDGVTYEQLKKVFPQALDEDLNTVVNELRGTLVTFKLDTPTRLRHFFSQIKGEVGPQMKGKTEGFQFSPDTLRSFSRYYRQHSSEADQDGYEKNALGRTIRRADEQAIGRKHYLRLNGNRQTNPEDGYNFRGRGLIQITGYEKYHGFPTDYNNYWSDNVPNTVDNPEIVNEMPYAIRSALWFWVTAKPYIADRGRGYDDVIAVTLVVNGGDMGLAERRSAYRLCEEVFL
ncbi:hypothetical protein CH54_3266 [Yersinia rochesterensis]|uniref:EF-hand domain-containing protein n=1 Tax=Yersinia rochesterensis TaxID=1604335 RepID=A0ABN4FK09_9GAMM|nr:chitinase [Yersinia rochesterensis]AIN19673.1 putative lysozyme [Yersinia rochesterensis]AJI87222.1 putative lysozyme [Yersinia frederiksenii Y225]AJJ37858.1 hypothetical protein CH54_3266 [Yersinia rochesterensis]CRY65339.1 putative endolysin [Yersinia kristensenii]